MPRKTIDITLPDLSGKRAVVTGASDGMGLVIAARLAAAGAEVIMPVRNRSKGDAAITKIKQAQPRREPLAARPRPLLAGLGRRSRRDPGRGGAADPPPHQQRRSDDAARTPDNCRRL